MMFLCVHCFSHPWMKFQKITLESRIRQKSMTLAPFMIGKPLMILAVKPSRFLLSLSCGCKRHSHYKYLSRWKEGAFILLSLSWHLFLQLWHVARWSGFSQATVAAILYLLRWGTVSRFLKDGCDFSILDWLKADLSPYMISFFIYDDSCLDKISSL